MARDTPDSDNDAMCVELKKDEGWKKSFNSSRPVSIASDITDRNEKRWVDIVSGLSNHSRHFLKVNPFLVISKKYKTDMVGTVGE